MLRAQTGVQLLCRLYLQIVFYVFHPAHFTGELFSPLLLLRRFHHAIQRYDLLSGINVDAGQIGRLVRHQFGLHICRDRRIVNELTGSLAGECGASAAGEQNRQEERLRIATTPNDFFAKSYQPPQSRFSRAKVVQ